MKNLIKNRAFVLGSASGILIFAALNVYDSLPESDAVCFHCYETFGFPFSYLGTGGYFTHTDILWAGLFADILVAILFSSVIGLIFKFVWSKILSPRLVLK